MEKLDCKEILAGLDKILENPRCELDYKTTFELLVAVILSAQCTDKRVNQITLDLFKSHNTPQDFVSISQENLEEKIHSCGFFHNKAKSIKSASFDIIKRFGGQVPENFEDLVTLAGVGRKTANVIVSEAFKGDAIAVDTHVLRLSNRWGLVKTSNPNVCEEELKQLFPKDRWSRLHYQMVLFGRYTCKAVKPNCQDCIFNIHCPSSKVGVPNL